MWQYQNVIINHEFCKDAIDRAIERFKREPIACNLIAYRIAGAKARKDIRLRNKYCWRKYVSKMNSQALFKSVCLCICSYGS